MTVSFIRNYILKEQGMVRIPVLVSQNMFTLFYRFDTTYRTTMKRRWPCSCIKETTRIDFNFE